MTLFNVAKNCPGRLGDVRVFAGDWADVAALLQREHLCYDVVLGSDTVYSVSSLASLLSVTAAALDPATRLGETAEDASDESKGWLLKGRSTAFFTGRSYYFGVGGGTRDLCRLVDSTHPELCWRRAEHFAQGVERETVAISFA